MGCSFDTRSLRASVGAGRNFLQARRAGARHSRGLSPNHSPESRLAHARLSRRPADGLFQRQHRRRQPEILAALAAATAAQPYGADEGSAQVRRQLADIFEREVDVLLVPTGTAANSLSLSALTPPWGSVLCHAQSHIANDECGAPEFLPAARA